MAFDIGRYGIGRYGVFSASGAWRGHPEEIAEAAAEVEQAGYGALWLGGVAGHLLRAEAVLAASRRLVVATGIVSIWDQPAEDLAAAHRRVTAAHPGRLLLGLGTSHAQVVDRNAPGAYRRPVQHMIDYLDRLDGAVPAGERMLAALGPRLLEISARRSAGAHTYLVTPEHTAVAREILGAGPLLAAEHKVVLTPHRSVARDLARPVVGFYLTLPHYVNNLRRLGWTDRDLSGGGSDRLLDALVAWGSPEKVAARLREHLDAGAGHVVVQVLTGDVQQRASDGWRRLAPALS